MAYNLLLAVDLDGDVPATPLSGELAAAELAIVYLTSQTLDAALDTLSQRRLPPPRFFISQGGLAIHQSPEWQLDGRWERELAKGWSPGRIRAVAAFFPGLAPAPPPSRFICNYSLEDEDAEATLGAFEVALRRHRLKVRIRCEGGLIELRPNRAGKLAALSHLANRLSLPRDRVMVADPSSAAWLLQC